MYRIYMVYLHKCFFVCVFICVPLVSETHLNYKQSMYIILDNFL